MSKKVLTSLLVAVFLIGTVATVAISATYEVPEDYDTITEALASDEVGADDTIDVRSDYDFDGEEFPILVQKDDVTIDGNEADFDGNAGDAPFLTVGAKTRLNDEGVQKNIPVSGITVKNFVVNGETPVAFVVKHAEDVTIEDNTVDASAEGDWIGEGIRLIDTTTSTVTDNTITAVGSDKIYETDAKENLVGGNGIGIFVQNSSDNELSDNTVSIPGWACSSTTKKKIKWPETRSPGIPTRTISTAAWS